MKYINELNAFDRRMHRAPLSNTAQLLWYKLMAMANFLHWPQEFKLDNQRLREMLNVGSLHTVQAARQELVDDGLLIFTPGVKGKPSIYAMQSVEALEKPQIVFPDEEAPDAFMGEVKEDITMYYGYTEALGQELNQVVDALWAEFHPGERPTPGDIFRVFSYIKVQTQNEDGSWTMEFPREKKELLAYAFDQARQNGKITWSYIAGIYRNLHARGIKTVDEAYDFDYARRPI